MNKVIKKGVGKYTLKEGQESGVEVMSTSVITTASGLKISYVNPNTPEELAEQLINIIVVSMSDTVISNKEKQAEKHISTEINKQSEES